MAGTLFVVATPIGNLEDITLRALRVLREVDVIAAEDTRRTAKLLAHHGIATPTVSFHEHNVRTRVPQLLSRLAAGESIAVVSDAGTPGISDPGLELVQGSIANGIAVDPIPGVSAPLAAVVASGFPLVPLTVYGFVPHRSNDRKTWWKSAGATLHTFTCFESPHRVQHSMVDAQPYLGIRPILLAREITKLHQQFVRGTAASLPEQVSEARGEFTIVVGPSEVVETKDVDVSDDDVASVFGDMAKTTGLRRGELVAAVAKKLGKPRRDVYAALERHKKSVN